MDVGAVNSLSSVKGKTSSGPRDGCFQVRWSTFSTRLQCKQERWQTIVWHRQTEQVMVQGVSPQSQAKEKVKTTMENPKVSPKEPKVRSKIPKAQAKVKRRKRVSQVSKTWNQKQARKLRNQCKMGDEWSPHEWNDNWSLDEWNDDWIGVGWHEDCEPKYNNLQALFHSKAQTG